MFCNSKIGVSCFVCNFECDGVVVLVIYGDKM